jgi:concanavalin A-like lectin/glucanase superfamily protein
VSDRKPVPTCWEPCTIDRGRLRTVNGPREPYSHPRFVGSKLYIPMMASLSLVDDEARAKAEANGESYAPVLGLAAEFDRGRCADALGPNTDAGATPVAGGCQEVGQVARWKLDDGPAGTHVHDCTSSQLHGRLESGTWLVLGRRGGALDLDGNGRITFDGRLPASGELSVGAWIRVRELPEAPAIVIAESSRPGTEGWALSIGPRGASFSVARGPGLSPLEASAPLPIGDWVHLGGVFAPGESVRLFVGGQLRATASEEPPATKPGDGRLGIGATISGEGWFVGNLDDVRIYTRALEPFELTRVAGE